MKKLSAFCLAMLLCVGMLVGCASEEPPVSSDSSSSETSRPASEPSQSSGENGGVSEEDSDESGAIPAGTPTVYLTTDISAEGMIAVYEALEASPPGILR